MPLQPPQLLADPRLANFAVTVAILATVSAAAPVYSDNIPALTVMLGCTCMVLTGAVVALLASRRTDGGKSRADSATDIVSSSRDAIFVIKESGEILSGNRSAEDLFGYTFEELHGMNFATLVPPPAERRRRASFTPVREGSELFGVRKADGNFPLDLVLSELPRSGGKRFSVIVRDRSKRNRAEEEREEQRRFASSLVEHLPSLLIVVDQDGRIVRFNRTCEELTQISERDVRGQFLWQAVAADTELSVAEKEIRQLLSGDFPTRSQSNWHLRDKTTRIIAWSHNALRDEYGHLTHMVSLGVDATNAVQWEARNREALSLQTAGRLAGGVAHDFNNLLTAISGYSGLALANLSPLDPVRNDIEEIRQASDRGAALTRQLLTFSGHRPRSPQMVDCNDLVRNIERLIRVLVGDGIHVDLTLEPNLPSVFADGHMLEECLMHLVANAREAMPHGGTLQIQTGRRSLNRTRVDARPPIGPGEYVTLSIVDTGEGISAETLPHVFEPFFTTKQSAPSNGMGLAMVYGIVRQAEGSIVVHSAPKYGSTFRIFLPLAAGQMLLPTASALGEEALWGDETVLLAIESDQERQKLRAALRSAGYRVLDARSGLHALEVAYKATEIIHLLVTSLTLPRMSGASLSESVTQRIPAVRTLFATSLGVDEITRRGMRPELVLRLDQTFDRRQVLLRIREALTAPSRR